MIASKQGASSGSTTMGRPMLACGLTGHSVQIKKDYYLWPLQLLCFLQAGIDCVDLVRKHAEQLTAWDTNNFEQVIYRQMFSNTKSF